MQTKNEIRIFIKFISVLIFMNICIYIHTHIYNWKRGVYDTTRCVGMDEYVQSEEMDFVLLIQFIKF